MSMRRVFCVGLALTASLILTVPSLRGRDLLQSSISSIDRSRALVLAQNAGTGRPFDPRSFHFPFASSFSNSHTENAGLIYGGDFDFKSLPNPGTIALLLAGWACILMIHRHYRKG